MRSRFDASGLWWGLVFALLASLALWRATGHEVSQQDLTAAAPFVLIGLGLLRLLLGVLARRRN